MDELIEILKERSMVELICTLITFYVAGKWVIGEVNGIRDWYTNKLKNYHTKENEKELKEDEIESRFSSIENKLNTDYIRIQKSESHLYVMTEQLKDMNNKFNNLNDMLIELRLETMRGRILDFAPLAIDLKHPQSKERYTEIYKVHADYIQLIEQTGKKNNYETYNFELIEKSYEQRSINKLFTEDCYIAPAKKHDDKEKYEKKINNMNKDEL